MDTGRPTATVLIVDDDRGVARLLERAVKREGYAAVMAFSGEHALRWLGDHSADLMLLDLKLPDMSGAELSQRLQQIGSAVPFVVITGQGDARLAVEMMKQGAIDYLVKDVQFLDFVPAVVRRALGQIEQGKRVAAAEAERKRLEAEVLEISGREQRRIGQDLHDGLGQILIGINLLARTLQTALERKSLPEEEQSAATIAAYALQAAAQTRLLARGLTPVQIEKGGLASALQELAKDTQTLAKVNCQFRCHQPLRIDDPALATHLYRIAQEAITNSIKHGRAGRIEIDLSDSGSDVTLAITDDGSGMPPNQNGSSGMGLQTMRYRAEMIGARLQFEPAAPRGLKVICSLDRSTVNAVGQD